MYNFKKLKNKQGMPEFYHPLFKKGGLNDLYRIERKTSKNMKLSQMKESQNSVPLSKHLRLVKRLEKVENKVGTLERKNAELINKVDKLTQNQDDCNMGGDGNIQKICSLVLENLKACNNHPEHEHNSKINFNLINSLAEPINESSSKMPSNLPVANTVSNSNSNNSNELSVTKTTTETGLEQRNSQFSLQSDFVNRNRSSNYFDYENSKAASRNRFDTVNLFHEEQNNNKRLLHSNQKANQQCHVFDIDHCDELINDLAFSDYRDADKNEFESLENHYPKD